MTNSISETRLQQLIELYELTSPFTDDTAAALRELQRMRRAVEWQPIATCPKHTKVLLGWSGLSGCEMGYVGEYKAWGWPGEDDDAPPTHWMPLPSPPADGGKGE